MRNYDAGSNTQGGSYAIINPADLEAAEWPSATEPDKAIDALPRKGDHLIVGGRQRALTRHAEPVRIGDTIVRLNLHIEG